MERTPFRESGNKNWNNTHGALARLMESIEANELELKLGIWDWLWFNPYPRKGIDLGDAKTTERLGLLFLKPQEWEKIKYTTLHLLTVPLYMTKVLIKNGKLDDNRYTKIKGSAREMIEDVLGMFPRDILEENLSGVFIWNLKKRNGKDFEWTFDWHNRWLYLSWEYRERTIYHELLHAILLHRSSKYYTSRWISLFWDGFGNTQDYAPQYELPWFPYGMNNANEDMATIWSSMFYKDNWKILRTKMSLNAVFRRKVDTLILFLSEATQWKLNKEYFDKIASWSIANAEDAQKFFTKNSKNNPLGT